MIIINGDREDVNSFVEKSRQALTDIGYYPELLAYIPTDMLITEAAGMLGCHTNSDKSKKFISELKDLVYTYYKNHSIQLIDNYLKYEHGFKLYDDTIICVHTSDYEETEKLKKQYKNKFLVSTLFIGKETEAWYDTIIRNINSSRIDKSILRYILSFRRHTLSE